VHRPGGGRLDVLCFPARQQSTFNTRAVLYCNPNAGLVEVTAGMSLIGGNLPSASVDNSQTDGWVDYYTGRGIDVYVFNYAGYGRSFGTTICSSGAADTREFHSGYLARISRIFRSFLSFQPSPDTLRQDAIAVAQYLITQGRIEELVLHGESIGGMAAAGAAHYLSRSPDTLDKLALLICDRTFCNLEAVAQRLVGDWTGYAIRCLAPFWNTDVAGDFLAAQCPKVVANDAADQMIADSSSLKSGVALWKEIHRSVIKTKGIGWVTETPLQYRMAEWENVCVNESKYASSRSPIRTNAPVWPADKHVSVEEAFHFAACCKRIGKIAKDLRSGDLTEVVEITGTAGKVSGGSVVLEAWKIIACCDGLTGAPLGISVKRGFDATVSWLCCCLIFGGQRVVALAEKRSPLVNSLDSTLRIIEAADFDARPSGYEEQESEGMIHTKPIPEVVAMVISLLEKGDQSVAQCKSFGHNMYTCLYPRFDQLLFIFRPTLILPLNLHSIARISVCPGHASIHSESFIGSVNSAVVTSIFEVGFDCRFICREFYEFALRPQQRF
jgi:hypothetical protein